MTPYDRTFLDATLMNRFVRKLIDGKILSDEDGARYLQQEELKTISTFLRVTFFILTIVGISGVLGLALLMTKSPAASSSLAGVTAFILLEYVTNIGKHWGTGVDDALATVLPLFFLGLFLEGFDKKSMQFALVLAWFIYLFLSIRYINLIAAFICSFGIYGVIAYLAKTMDTWYLEGTAILIFCLSVGLNRIKTFLPWQTAIEAAMVSSMLAFFALMPSTFDGRFHWHDINFTGAALIAGLYLVGGILGKSPTIYRTGLFCFLAVVTMYQLSTSLAGLDILLLSVGVILFVSGILFEKLLRSPKFGFTSRRLLDPDYNLLEEAIRDRV